jgi:type IV pilus assembly protein PilP
MKRQLNILLGFIWIAAIISLVGCGEKAPPAQPTKSISKKIAVQPRTTPVPKLESAKSESVPGQTSGTPQTPAAAPESEAKTPETSDLIKASLQIASSYDPAGRFDPFEPLFKEQQEEQAPKGAIKPKKPERDKTPLERVSLSQLKVSAIIRAPSGNRALVADATGKGYVVQKGTYIGLNSGQVIAIEKDRIVIEEEVENLMGELTIKNAELKLQKPAGEL